MIDCELCLPSFDEIQALSFSELLFCVALMDSDGNFARHSKTYLQLSSEELRKILELKISVFQLESEIAKRKSAALDVLSNCLDRLIAEADSQISAKQKKEKS